MKKSLCSAVVLLTAFTSCIKETESITPAREETTKTIHFSIFKEKDYSDPIYQGVRAEVKLAVVKMGKTNGEQNILWDSTLVIRPLDDFPGIHYPISVNKQFFNINDMNEQISASYFIRYRDAHDQVSSKGRNEFANPGTSVLTLPVRL